MQKHAPHVPGDVVRDRKNQQDYIIQAIVAAGTVGMISYQLVGVLDDRLEDIWVQNQDQFKDLFMTVEANTVFKDPQLILSELRSDFEKILGRDKIIDAQIGKQENSALKDLIYVARKGDAEQFSRDIVDLAEALVSGVQGRPDKATIRRLLSELAEDKLHPEFLDDLTERVNAQVVSVSIRTGNRRLMDPSSFQDLLQFTKHEYSFAEQAGLFSRARPVDQLPTLGRAERKFLSTLFSKREFGTNDFGFWPELNETEKGLDRAMVFAKEMFSELTGKPISKSMEARLRSKLRESQRLLRLGKSNTLTELMVKVAGVEEGKRLTHYRPGSLVEQVGRKFNLNQRVGRSLRSGPYQYLQRTFPRSTGIRRPKNLSLFRERVNWQGLIKNPKIRAFPDLSTKNTARLLSIDTQTFLHDLIGDRAFKVHMGSDAPTLKLRDPNSIESLLKTVGLSDSQQGNVVLTPVQLEQILKSREAGEVLDLAEVAQFNKQVSNALPSDIRRNILDTHYQGIFPTGERVTEVYVPKNELHSAVSNIADARKAEGLMNKIQKLTGSPKEGHYRAWAVQTQEGTMMASTDLQQVLDYMLSNPGAVQKKGLQFLDVAQPIPKLGPIMGGTQATPVFVDPGVDTRTFQGLTHALGRTETINPAINSLTRAELRNPNMSMSSISGEKLLSDVAQHKIAVGLIKNPETASESKLLVTSLRTSSIEEQLQLVREMYENGATFLDIETRRVHGRWQLTDLGYVDGDLQVRRVFNLRSQNVEVEQAEALIKLGNDLSRAKVVASHTYYDPDTLLSEAHRLSANLQFSHPELSDQLDKAAGQIAEARSNRWLDLTVAHQLRTGSRANLINQEWLAFHYLSETEPHEALGDALQARRLVMQGKEDILGNLNNLELVQGSEQLSRMPHFIMEQDPRGYRYGRILRLEDAITLPDGRAAAKVREYVPQMRDGKYEFKPSAMAFEEQADSVYGLAGMFAKRGISVTPESFSEVSEIWEQAITEQSGRSLRNLSNLLTLRPYDVLGSYKGSMATDMGPLPLVHYRASVDALKNYDTLHTTAQELLMADKDRIKAYSGAVRNLSVQDYLADAASIIAQRLNTPGNSLDSRQFYRDLVQSELITMAQSPQYLAQFDKSMPMGEFINSPLGKQLNYALAHDQTEPFHPLMLLMSSQEEAWKKLGNNIPVKNYGYRLGGEFANARISLKLGDLTHENIFEASNQMRSFGSDILLNLDRKSGGPATEFLASMIGMERAQEVAEAVENLRIGQAIDKYDTSGWRSLISQLDPSQGESHKLVYDTLKTMETHDKGLYHALQQVIIDRQEKLLTAATEIGEVEKGQQLVQGGTELLEHLSAVRSEGVERIQDIMRLALQRLTEQPNTNALEFLLDQGADTEKLMTQMMQFSNEEVQQFMHQAQADLAKYGSVEAQNDVFDFAAHHTKDLRGIERTQAFLSIVRQQQTEPIKILSEQTNASNALQRILAQVNDSSRVETEALHEVMGRTTGNVGGERVGREVVHEMIAHASSARAFTSLATPLMAAGAVLAVLGAVEPQQDHFSQGQLSQSLPIGQPYAARYAEIPGLSKTQRSWKGESDPWQLDITFEGYVADKAQQEELYRDVFNLVSGQVEVRKNHSQIADDRESSHRLTSREFLRRNL